MIHRLRRAVCRVLGHRWDLRGDLLVSCLRCRLWRVRS